MKKSISCENDSTKQKQVPIWEKYALTLDEAASYTNIGINTLRELANNPHNNFVLYVGKKRLLKRKLLEEYLNQQKEL